VTLWSEINPDWPETEICWYTHRQAAAKPDFLSYTLIGDPTLPFRTDGPKTAILLTGW
jgi:hypothetical protein